MDFDEYKSFFYLIPVQLAPKSIRFSLCYFHAGPSTCNVKDQQFPDLSVIGETF